MAGAGWSARNSRSPGARQSRWERVAASWSLRVLLGTVVLALGASRATPAVAASVVTNQSDYFPGSTVIVTGSGWLPNEPVSMVLTEFPQVDPILSLASTADPEGNFTNTQYTVLADDVGITFTLTATGGVSGSVAATTFTDSGIGAGSLASPTGTLPETGMPFNPTHWMVQAGDMITGQITNATDAIGSPCAVNGVNVFVQSSNFGNTALCGTLSGTTITFMWTVPPEACSTSVITYNTMGNHANAALIPGGNSGSAAGYAIVDGSGNVITCGGETTTTTTSTTTTTEPIASTTTSTTEPQTTTTTSSTTITGASTTSTTTTTTTTPTTESLPLGTSTTSPANTTSTTEPPTTTTTAQTTSTTTTEPTATTTTTAQMTSTTTTEPTATTTTTTSMSTTSTTMCIPTGPEAGHCNDGIDNDCNGLIDCQDPACQPAICFGGSKDDTSCATEAGQVACVNAGGVCQCPSIDKDPTSITFSGGRGLDRFRSHGRVFAPGQTLMIESSPVSWLLSHNGGKIFSVGLPAGALTSNSSGTRFTYSNRSAKTLGGIYLVKLQQLRGTVQTLRYTVEAYGDLSAATDPDMAVQFYVANQPTPAIHTQPFQRTPQGWRAR